VKTVLAWLNETVVVVRPPDVQHQMKIVERLAELIAVNFGKTNVERWGQPQAAPGHPYGRVVLTMPEALELINLNGIYSGFIFCQEDPLMVKASQKMIQEEILRVKKEGFNPVQGMENAVGLVKIYSETDMKEISKLDKQISRTLKT
jgi:hypothetical protein